MELLCTGDAASTRAEISWAYLSERSCVIPLDIDAQIDFKTDLASTRNREYYSGYDFSAISDEQYIFCLH